MNHTNQSAYNSVLSDIIVALLFWGFLAALITYLVNRRRQTAGLAKATLFLTIWGIITVLPALLAIPTGHLALRQIRLSGGALKGKFQAWFGLVCGYGWLLTLLGFVGFGVGIVSQTHQDFVKERSNVQVIEGAKAAWAAANNKTIGDVATASELGPFMPGGQFPPPSIQGERYEINPLGVKPTIVDPPPEY